jgi:hypothetical protein
MQRVLGICLASFLIQFNNKIKLLYHFVYDLV